MISFCCEKCAKEKSGPRPATVYCTNSECPCHRTTPPTTSWERYVRVLANSTNKRDVDLLVAKLKVEFASDREEAYNDGLCQGEGLTNENEYELGREAGKREEHQFFLNILDGIDIADKELGVEGGTLAIRHALKSRYLGEEAALTHQKQ